MKQKIKEWYIMSATTDFYRWHNDVLTIIIIIYGSFIMKTSFILWILFVLIFSDLQRKYFKFWRDLYLYIYKLENENKKM